MFNINSSLNQEFEHNVEFQTTNQEGEETIEIYDLNKMFQLNFSYNFDLLKNLMEAIMKNQQTIQNDLKIKHTKILDLETQLLDLKLGKGIKSSENSDRNQQIETNPKLISVIKGNKDILRPPPNDVKLEVSIGNDDMINQIIVSIKLMLNYL